MSTSEEFDDNLDFHVPPDWRKAILIVLGGTIIMWAIFTSPLRPLIDDGISRPMEYSFREAVDASLPLDPRIKMIAFDDLTAGALERPDLTLADWALIFEYLATYEPRVIFIDRIFGLPLGATLNSGVGSTEAEEFIKRMQSLKVPIVVGAFVQAQKIERRQEMNLAGQGARLPEIIGESDWQKHVATLPWLQTLNGHIYGPHPKILGAFDKVGLINNEGSGFIRPMVRVDDERVLLHSSLATVGALGFDKGRFTIGGVPLPIPKDGRLTINLSERQAYHKQTDNLLHHIRMINDGERDEWIRPDDIVAILPMMYTGNTDMKDLPIGRLQGSYLNISAINNALAGTWLSDFPWVFSAIFVSTGLAAAIACTSQPFVFIGLMILLLGVQVILGLATFAWSQTIFPWVYTVTGSAFVGGLVFVDMARKIEEKKRMAALKALEGARMRKLLHVVCHDIANPLMVVATRVEMAGGDHQRVLDKVPEVSNLDKISYATEKIRNIITSVRQLEAAETGKTTVDLAPVSLPKLCEAVRLNFEDRLAKKKLEFVIDLPENQGEIWVYADRVSLENFVIANLVSNAIKFSPPGANIRLSATVADRHVKITVSDQGIGIPADLMGKIFSSSEHTTRPGTSDELGTGFGMPIVKSYVTRFGGSIEIASKTEDESPDDHGTQITVTLKQTDAPAPGEESPDSREFSFNFNY